MVDSLVRFFTEGLTGIVSEGVIVFIISLLPILELRGGLIAASLLNIEMYRAVIICIVGNLLPIPFILMFIRAILQWMKHFKCFRGMVNWLENKSKSKSETIEKYEFLGLLIFVGIPLPGTGAWTGALIAALLKIKPKKAFLAITCGVVLASIIMCVVAYVIPALVALLF